MIAVVISPRDKVTAAPLRHKMSSTEAANTNCSANALQENTAGLATSLAELRQAVIEAVRNSTSEVRRRGEMPTPSRAAA